MSKSRVQLEQKIASIERKISHCGQENNLDHLISEKSRLKKKISSKYKCKGAVSDHAIVRYMERVLGVNIKELKDEIVKSNHHKVIKRGVIVTIRPHGT